MTRLPYARVTASLALVLGACAPAADQVVAPTAGLPSANATASASVVAAALPSVYVSEIHYDNTGTDAGEAIEVNAPAGTDLTGWSLVLYNGSNSLRYDQDPIGGVVPATCGSRGVLVVNYPPNGIQNGAPDGVALVNAAGEVVEFLSYEGVITAADGPAAGLTSTSIGVFEAGSEPLGQSLQRTSAGWTGPVTASFGSCNVEPEPPAAASITPASATVPVDATVGLQATAVDSDGQPTAATFTWSSLAPLVATVDPATGEVTGRSLGTATIQATTQNGIVAQATVEVVAGAPTVRFSEIHYDNDGADVGEAIEVAAPAGTDLTGWQVVLYNGSNGAVYNTRTLSGTVPNQCAGRGTIALTYPSNGIQNGSPDGFALVNAAGELVEFLSYEGTLVATDGPAAGQGSIDIGVAQPSSAAIGSSLKRSADGTTWATATASDFGQCNGSGGPPPPPAKSISFAGRDGGDPPLPVGFEDQLFATFRIGGTVTPTTFAWVSETPLIASVDQRGVVRALAAGTAIIRATAADGTTATFTLATREGQEGSAEYAGNTQFGIPLDDTPADDFVIVRDEFTTSFNPVTNIPNWVSYNLDGNDLGSEDRCDCFTYDPLLPESFTRYTTADYTGAGAIAGFGIDRGHLAPSADRTTGSLDNARTFYFSNIIPQAADNNQGPWAAFESHLRARVRAENVEVYVITGAYGSQGTVKNEGLITIPTRTWKVAIVVPAATGPGGIKGPFDFEVIAIDLPNSPGIRNTTWQSYATTVDAIEAASGYDLLRALPDGIERVVEGELRGHWR